MGRLEWLPFCISAFFLPFFLCATGPFGGSLFVNKGMALT